jgi:hypothetical protein
MKKFDIFMVISGVFIVILCAAIFIYVQRTWSYWSIEIPINEGKNIAVVACKTNQTGESKCVTVTSSLR